MNHKPRYATVRKYATRELVSGDFQHAVFGAKIRVASNKLEIKLASTPEEIVYFLDDVSYMKFIKKVHKQFPIVDDVCAVHR